MLEINNKNTRTTSQTYKNIIKSMDLPKIWYSRPELLCMCRSPFIIKLLAFSFRQARNYIQKAIPKQVFSCEFRKNFKKTFLKGYLRATASAH